MSQDVKFAMMKMGANPARFPINPDYDGRQPGPLLGRLCKGGLSTAIEAGIHEAVLFLPTGHGQAKAARDYMIIRDSSVLMQVFGAFKL